MECKHFCEPQCGKLGRQVLGGVIIAYDLCLGHSRECWEGITKENNNKNRLNNEFSYGVPLNLL